MTTEELQKLTPEEKRILIAEARGWTKIELAYDDEGELTLPKGTSPDGGSWAIIPDYLNDLNAIHKSIMEEIYNKGLQSAWFRALGYAHPNLSAFERNNATAAQRADAFLLTTNPTQ